MATEVLRRNHAATGSTLIAPSTQLSDMTDIAQRAWTRALESCANRMGSESTEAAADQMRRGNNIARMHCCHGLAEQIAASLRSSYQNIQAVYAPYCDTCPQSFCLDKGALNTPLVHLIIWTPQKSSALSARAAGLGNALARVCQDMIGMQELPNLLHAQLIDDADLEKLFGAGHRERWPLRLPAYFLDIDEPVEEM